MKHWPFIVINDSTRPKVQVEYKGETKTFFPEEISSMVLVKMKEIAEAYLGKVRRNTLVYNCKFCIVLFILKLPLKLHAMFYDMLMLPLFCG